MNTPIRFGLLAGFAAAANSVDCPQCGQMIVVPARVAGNSTLLPQDLQGPFWYSILDFRFTIDDLRFTRRWQYSGLSGRSRILDTGSCDYRIMSFPRDRVNRKSFIVNPQNGLIYALKTRLAKTVLLM
jgi:hypothetical protein